MLDMTQTLFSLRTISIISELTSILKPKEKNHEKVLVAHYLLLIFNRRNSHNCVCVVRVSTLYTFTLPPITLMLLQAVGGSSMEVSWRMLKLMITP